MDEDEFKNIYGNYDPQRCHFAKAILTRCAGCARSQRVLIAEREAISCLSRAGHERCGTILPLLREKALFALGLRHSEQRLPHGKEMKVECGGLGALAGLLGAAGPDDVDALLQDAEKTYGAVERIPFGEIVGAISRYSLRKRGRQGRED
jgi:hypothetical protein